MLIICKKYPLSGLLASEGTKDVTQGLIPAVADIKKIVWQSRVNEAKTIMILQTARQLSRLLDGFYNTPAWQSITRKLILKEEKFLYRFLEHLIQIGLIDQPISLEKRGLILYEFCKHNYPEYQLEASIAWIEAGMSLKKLPAEKVKTKRQVPPENWQVLYGQYKENLRLCFLPVNEETNQGYWFGFESEIQKPEPVFKAMN